MKKPQDWIDGEAFLRDWENPNGVRLADHYSYSIRLDIAMPQPEYNLIQLNALRGNSMEFISCDINRDDFIAALENIMNVTITKNEDYQ